MEEVKIQLNPDGWGPLASLPPFAKDYEGLMFNIYDKAEPVGKLCDFLTQTGRRERQKLEKEAGINLEEGDSAFTFVESKSALKTKKPAYKKPESWQKKQGGAGGTYKPPTQQPFQQQSNYTRSQQISWQKKQQIYHQQQQQRYIARNRMYKDLSFPIQQTWISIKDFNKHHFEKMLSTASEGKTLCEAGQLGSYITQFDRVIPNKPVPLRYVDSEFVYPELLSDQNIQRLAENNEANVFITDEALAILMTAPRSIYSWDLSVNKYEDVLFIDYTENSKTPYLSVNENSSEPPPADTKEQINTPLKLHLESTNVNHYFRQQVSAASDVKKYSTENLFKETYNDFPNYLYKYRVFEVSGGLKICVRCQLEARTKKKDSDEDTEIKVVALNEYDIGRKGNWRSSLETRRGATLNNEILNNGCKVARWACQAYLAGCDSIKMGLVSRSSSKSAEKHVIMGVTEYDTKALFQQINLSLKQAWGSVKLFLECMRQFQDSSYLIMKEPTKMSIKVYEKPSEQEAEEEESPQI